MSHKRNNLGKLCSRVGDFEIWYNNINFTFYIFTVNFLLTQQFIDFLDFEDGALSYPTIEFK